MLESSMEARPAFTFDDVLIEPGYSEFLPGDVSTDSGVGMGLSCSIPVISAPMDTVTEQEMAIIMARLGGLGVIHRNMDAKFQAEQVKALKKFETWIVHDPVTVLPDRTVGELRRIMLKQKISGVPVVEGGTKKLLGIITHRDVRFVGDDGTLVQEVMTKGNLITASWPVDQGQALNLLKKHRLEKLIIVDKDGACQGLVTYRGIKQATLYPNSTKDSQGRFSVGAAIGVGPKEMDRAATLVDAGVDALFIDTAHGYTKGVIDTVRNLRKNYSGLNIVAGNVATKDGARALVDAGANSIKVGIGPGSICTTRIVAGVGVPQLTAIQNCVEVAHKNGVSVVADGGMRSSGDMAKAIACGADMVMLGSLLAGTEEAPGEIFLQEGKPYKTYRGMGSVGALSHGFASDRYKQNKNLEVVPEGVEAQVPYKGSVRNVMYQLVGGLCSSMSYAGCKTIKEMQSNCRFVQITDSGMKESHVHDVQVTRQAPNYPFLRR